MILQWLRRRRRQKLLAQPFPAEWSRILQARVPHYGRLPADDQRRLCDLLRLLIAEKNWEGCGGLVLTDEIKVPIAALACLLILNRNPDSYRRLLSILVYPDTYVAAESEFPRSEAKPVGAREGESWAGGPVILNWAEVLDNLEHPEGRNLVLHEFSHQLDPGGSASEGTFLKDIQPSSTWLEEMVEENRSFLRSLAAGEPTLLDRYGRKNSAEFFAVATECFFERPQLMRQQLSSLYRLLQQCYQQNPAEWRW